MRLSFAAGAAHSAPGVTVTGGSGNDATGYLTPASARAFGRALAAQWKSDARPGAHPSGKLFGGLTRIGLDTPAFSGRTSELSTGDADHQGHR